MGNQEELIQEVKHLIGANRTEKALELLEKAQLSNLDKGLTILKSRYSKVKEDQRLGIVDDDLAQRRLNKINLDLLELSEKIWKKPIKTVSSITSSNETIFNKWWIIAALLLAGVIALIIILNYNPEEKAWQEALKENKLSSYLAFIKNYPEGEFTFEANNYIEDFTWKNALAKNTIEAYEVYMENHPEGDSITEARRYIERLKYELNQAERDRIMSAWTIARNLNTADSYQTFINNYPNADSTRNAKSYIKRIEAWQRAIASKSFKPLSDFNSLYPKYDSIRFRIEELKPVVEKKFMTFFRFDNSTKDVFRKNNCKASVKSKFIGDRYNSDNKALDLDGKNDYLKPSNLVFKDFSSNRYSISLWVYFPRSKHGGTLFGQFPNEGRHGRKNHYIELYPNKLLIDEFLPGGRHLDAKLSISAGKWNHIVIARDLQSVSFYLNGNKIKTWPYVEKYTDDGLGKISLAYIGAGIDSKGQMKNHFTGIIDDLGFIKSTLSESEVKFIYAVQKTY